MTQLMGVGDGVSQFGTKFENEVSKKEETKEQITWNFYSKHARH